MDMVNDDVENQIVVAEREKEPGTASRARTTILTGRVKHECNLRPILTDGYRARLKERVRTANKPKRTIQMIEDHTGRGDINRLTSGAASHVPFNIVVRALLSSHFRAFARAPRGAAPAHSARRKPSRSRRKASTSAWRVYRATSCSTSCSARSRSASGGLFATCASAHSSLRRTSRRCSARSRSCTAAESTTGRGSSCRTTRATGCVLSSPRAVPGA